MLQSIPSKALCLLVSNPPPPPPLSPPILRGVTAGDLFAKYLECCPKVERVSIDNTNATGDVSALFSNKHNLRDVSTVGCGTISGDFGALAAPAGAAASLGIRSLDLRKCSGLGGELAGAAGMGGTLEVLCLDGTAVAGRLEGLACPRLRRLRLGGLAVGGDLAALGSRCPLLEELFLDGTGVAGKLEVGAAAPCSLSAAPPPPRALFLLLSPSSYVSSDLTRPLLVGIATAQDLAGLVHLESLCLEGLEGVSGDLRGLAGLLALREVRLNGTKARGDLASLSHLGGLTELRLHGTYVTGDLWASLGGLAALVLVMLSADDFEGQAFDLIQLRTTLPDCNVLLL